MSVRTFFTLFSAAGNADSMLLKGSARGWSSTRHHSL